MIEQKIISGLTYVLQYPRNYDETKAYPVLIFMHGAGTRGNDINKLLTNPFFEITEALPSFPFIVAAPLCEENTWNDVYGSVLEFIDEIYNRPDTDKSRFFAIGASMGGYAVWQMAMSRPSLFSAIIPICGGGMYWNAGRIKHIPVWAFHGDSDDVVFTEESIKMINRINSLGGNAKLTVYENCFHDAWSATYKNPEVFDWLLSQKNKKAVDDDTTFTDSKIYG